MFFLAIETSCDETAAAVFTEEPAVLSSIVASQTDLHVRFGGVVPEVAARAHLQRLLPIIDEALRAAGIGLDQVGCVAVHHTPGLVGALLVGVSCAKMLALTLGVPLIGVNHIAAHIYACRLAAGRDIFPCVGLVVSGGHTALFHCRTALDFDVLVRKGRQALVRTGQPRSAVGGAVTANCCLRAALAQMTTSQGAELFIPPLTLCTDNAAMAALAVEKWRLRQWAPPDLDAVPS